MSSRSPGCSPTNMISASGGLSPNTSGSHSSIMGSRDTKRLRGASYQVCRSAGGRLRQRSRLDEQCDGDEGNDDQSATGDEHVTDIMPRGTCPHRCLIGLGHDRTFVLIHRTLLSHEANRLPFQSRPKTPLQAGIPVSGRYRASRAQGEKRPKDQIVPMRRRHINYAAALARAGCKRNPRANPRIARTIRSSARLGARGPPQDQEKPAEAG
jgi:hypothetical protein